MATTNAKRTAWTVSADAAFDFTVAITAGVALGVAAAVVGTTFGGSVGAVCAICAFLEVAVKVVAAF